MKLIIKIKGFMIICFGLFFIQNNIYSQISTIIPDRGFGNQQQAVVSSWMVAGAALLDNPQINVANMIDVTDEGIYPNSGPVGQAINDLLLYHQNNNLPLTIYYFPIGVYSIDQSLSIPSNVILKGESGSIYDEYNVTLFSFNTPGVCINFKENTSNSGIEDIGISDCFDPEQKFLNTMSNNSIDNKIERNDEDDFEDTIEISKTAHDCWIRGVEMYKTRRMHINIYGYSNTVSGCFIHDGWDYGDGGHAYGVCLSGSQIIGENGSYCNRIEDNIFKHLRHSMVFQYNPQVNVVAYNYSLDSYGTFAGQEIEVADLLFHSRKDNDIGPKWNLCEGNVVDWIRFDEGGYWPDGRPNGPYNTIFRCKASDKATVDKTAGGKNHQYKQNFVGLNAISDGNTDERLRDHGYFRYWHENPYWYQIPNDSCSYYLDIMANDKPDFFEYENAPNFDWPFEPDELNPAKYRYERNNNQHQQHPHIFHVKYVGWDEYTDYCGPFNYSFTDNAARSNLEDEYHAMQLIEAGPYELVSDNNVTYKCEEQIILKPGFKVNSANNNYFHAKCDDFCNSSAKSGETIIHQNSIKIPDSIYFCKLDNSHTDIAQHDDYLISDNNAISRITIGPNPNNGIFTVYLPHEESIINFQLLDANGRLVKKISDQYTTKITFDIRGKPKGMYILKIVSDEIANNYKIFYQ